VTASTTLRLPARYVTTASLGAPWHPLQAVSVAPAAAGMADVQFEGLGLLAMLPLVAALGGVVLPVGEVVPSIVGTVSLDDGLLSLDDGAISLE
jgi:hypothetical protein